MSADITLGTSPLLRPLVPDRLWHTQQHLRVGPLPISTRMTVVRLHDGGLWIHSPVRPCAVLKAELDALGPVRWVVAPNRSHHLHLSSFLAAFPPAGAFIAPGLEKKRPDLAHLPLLLPGAPRPWGKELAEVFIEGLPVLNETAWFHHASSTLILTDLLFCFGGSNHWLTRAATRLLGVHERLGMSRTMRWMIKDEEALRRSVFALARLRPDRIVLAHDQIIEDAAAERLDTAVSWLLSGKSRNSDDTQV